MIDKNQKFQLTIELKSIGFTVGGVFHFVMQNEHVSDDSIKVWIGDVLWKMITEIDNLNRTDSDSDATLR